MRKKINENWGIASLVLGIISILFFFIPFIGIFLGILAIVFYNLQKKEKITDVAKGGLITGIIGVVINGIILLIILGGLLLFGYMSTSYNSDTVEVINIDNIDDYEDNLIEKNINEKIIYENNLKKDYNLNNKINLNYNL